MIDTMDGRPVMQFVVRCENAQCPENYNLNITIACQLPPGFTQPTVICGSCGTPISQVAPLT